MKSFFKILVFLLALASGPSAFSSELAHWRGNTSPGQLEDSTVNNNDLTMNGTVTNASAPTPPEGNRWLGKLDESQSSSDYFTFPTAAFTTGSNSYFHFFFNVTTTSATLPEIVYIESTDISGNQLYISYELGSKLEVDVKIVGPGTVAYYTASDYSTWCDGSTHEAVFESNGSGFSFKIDGVLEIDGAGLVPDFDNSILNVNNVFSGFIPHTAGMETCSVYVDDMIFGDAISTPTPTPTSTASPSPSVTPTATPTSICLGITYDASSYASGTTTTQTWSHTVGVGTNRALVVGVHMNPGSAAVSGVTFNGVPLTLGIAHQAVLGNLVLDGELWYLLNPDMGSHSIVVTHSAATSVVAGAASYFGVGSVSGTASTDNGPGTSINTNVTTFADGSLITYLAGQADSRTIITEGADQTERWTQEYGANPDAVTARQGDMEASLAGLYFLDFTFSESSYNNLVALVLAPLCGATNTPTPTYTATPTASPSSTDTPVYTDTDTPTTSPTPSQSPTLTDTLTITETPTPRATPTLGSIFFYSGTTIVPTVTPDHIWGIWSEVNDVRIRSIQFTCSNSYALQKNFRLLKMSSEDSASCQVAITPINRDTDDGLSTAKVVYYTCNPTSGTVVGEITGDLATVYNETADTARVTWSFDVDERDLVLHPGEGIVLDLDGVNLDLTHVTAFWIEGALVKKNYWVDFNGAQPVYVVSVTPPGTYTATPTNTPSPTLTCTASPSASPTISATNTPNSTATPLNVAGDVNLKYIGGQEVTPSAVHTWQEPVPGDDLQPAQQVDSAVMVWNPSTSQFEAVAHNFPLPVAICIITTTPNILRTCTPDLSAQTLLTQTPFPIGHVVLVDENDHTYTPLDTSTFTPTISATQTHTFSPTVTPTPSVTGVEWPWITSTPTRTPTGTPSLTATSTLSPTRTNTFTFSPTISLTSTPTFTPNNTTSQTKTQTLTVTTSPTPTASVTAVFSAGQYVIKQSGAPIQDAGTTSNQLMQLQVGTSKVNRLLRWGVGAYNTQSGIAGYSVIRASLNRRTTAATSGISTSTTSITPAPMITTMGSSSATVTQFNSDVTAVGTSNAVIDTIMAVVWPVLIPSTLAPQSTFHDLTLMNASVQENPAAVDGQFFTIDVQGVGSVVPDQSFVDYCLVFTEEGLQ